VIVRPAQLIGLHVGNEKTRIVNAVAARFVRGIADEILGAIHANRFAARRDHTRDASRAVAETAADVQHALAGRVTAKIQRGIAVPDQAVDEQVPVTLELLIQNRVPGLDDDVVVGYGCVHWILPRGCHALKRFDAIQYESLHRQCSTRPQPRPALQAYATRIRAGARRAMLIGRGVIGQRVASIGQLDKTIDEFGRGESGCRKAMENVAIAGGKQVMSIPAQNQSDHACSERGEELSGQF